MRTVDYLDAVKAKHGLSSEAALERLLGVTHVTRLNYRQGRTAPDDRVALRIASLLETDPARVLADMAAERAQSDDARAVWEEISRRLCVMSTRLGARARKQVGNGLPLSGFPFRALAPMQRAIVPAV